MKKKYGGLVKKKPPLITKVITLWHLKFSFVDVFDFYFQFPVPVKFSINLLYICQDHERAFFDSADWALGKVLSSSVTFGCFSLQLKFNVEVLRIFITMMFSFSFILQQGGQKAKTPAEALRPKLEVHSYYSEKHISSFYCWS